MICGVWICQVKEKKRRRSRNQRWKAPLCSWWCSLEFFCGFLLSMQTPLMMGSCCVHVRTKKAYALMELAEETTVSIRGCMANRSGAASPVLTPESSVHPPLSSSMSTAAKRTSATSLSHHLRTSGGRRQHLQDPHVQSCGSVCLCCSYS